MQELSEEMMGDIEREERGGGGGGGGGGLLLKHRVGGSWS